MSEHISSFEQDEEHEQLSSDDMAILQAFEERDDWATGPLQAYSTSPSTHEEDIQQGQTSDDLDLVMMTFFAELDDDTGHMRHALSQLEQDDTLDMSRFVTIRRIAHKIRGTAGTVNCDAMATIASIMEDTAEQTIQHNIFPLVGISILVQSVHALELTLLHLLDTGQESREPLTNLESELAQLNTEPVSPSPSQSTQARPQTGIAEPVPDAPGHLALSLDAIASLHVDESRFRQLASHSEQLVELNTPLEDAQAQLQDALRELHTAQVRLQQQTSTLDRLSSTSPYALDNTTDHTLSSLVTHVLNRTTLHTKEQYAVPGPHTESSHSIHKTKRPLLSNPRLVKIDEEWDELEIMRYSGVNETLRALSEAISHVSFASSRVQGAYKHLEQVLQTYVSHVGSVRNNALSLRLTPVMVLTEQLQQVVATNSSQQAQDISFEATGESVELDITILEVLMQPLLHLLQTCLADISTTVTPARDKPYQCWLHAQSTGNEVLLELGFSMQVQGGALERVQNALRQVDGTLTIQRNTRGGVSFLLQLPRTQGTIRGLLVRVADQQVIIPFSQVQYIDDEKHAQLDIVYHLHRLLDIESNGKDTAQQRTTPILVLPKGTSQLVAGIVVDEVIADIEVVVKPLATYLQRPGITSAVVDGKGNVQLFLNLPELVRHYNTVLRHALPEQHATSRKPITPKVLIADDSLSMRQSLLNTLQRAHFETREANDGMEALEQLTKEPPDVFLLDMEMPNLSGYDVLSIMYLYHELQNVKVIMLTSRASEKHKRHALELGAHAYLTKPCSSEVLLKTIRSLLP
jgi:chemotaxis protein histidine kinase CheA